MITRGNHGCMAYSRKDGFCKIPALTSNVLDTVGAGDAFLSVSSPCIAMGLPLEQAAFIGNAAGALKVGIVGNRSSVEKGPLLKFLTTLLK
jgi:sugar/nucleoside kinase (ribokinase family)